MSSFIKWKEENPYGSLSEFYALEIARHVSDKAKLQTVLQRFLFAYSVSKHKEDYEGAYADAESVLREVFKK